jgi:hypothetical protein
LESWTLIIHLYRRVARPSSPRSHVEQHHRTASPITDCRILAKQQPAATARFVAKRKPAVDEAVSL